MEIIEAVSLVAYLVIVFAAYKVVMIQLDINSLKRELKVLESQSHYHVGGKDIGK
jgi:hypothetical protein